MIPIFIYALNDPVSGVPRYVGKTRSPDRRLSSHLCQKKSKKASHLKNWVGSLLKLGLKPVMEILDVVPDSEWVFWEREYIENFRERGFDLVNCSSGGEGPHNPSEATRKKMGAWQRGPNNHRFGKPAWNRGRVASPEEREVNSVSHQGLKYPPKSGEYRDRCSVMFSGRVLSESAKNNMRKPKSEAGRLAIGVAQRERRRREKKLTV